MTDMLRLASPVLTALAFMVVIWLTIKAIIRRIC